jgi:hypothetical protein
MARIKEQSVISKSSHLVFVFRASLTAAVVALTGASAHASVNFLSDPGFEQAAYQMPATDVPGWQVTPADSDTYTQITSEFGNCDQGSAKCFYTKTGSATISQTFSDVAGQSLSIGAAIESHGDNSFSMLFNGKTVLTETFTAPTGWENYSVNVTATGRDTISFVTGKDNWQATVIDNTFATGSAVPETSTWAMLLLGFTGMGLAAMRRNRKLSPVAG